MTRPAPRDSEAGLTLIEMLVALAVSALIGVAGLAILDTVLRVNRGTEGRLERLAEIDRALTVIGRDLAQRSGPRVTLDAEGLSFDRLAPGASGGVVSVRFSHAAPDVFLRSVGPVDAPSRTATAAPPGASGSDTGAPALEQRLLTGVTAADFTLLDRDGGWHDRWPPASGATAQTPAQPAAGVTDAVPGERESPPDPRGARVTLSLIERDGGAAAQVVRLVPLPAAVPE